MRVLVGVLGFVLSLAAGPVTAVHMTGLYQVRETVTDSSAEARQAALSQAFASLVWRLSGTEELSGIEALQPYVSDPQALITGYSHRSQALQVSFDANSVLRVLQQAQLPVWGAHRPMTLVWWSQQDSHGQQLFSDGQLKTAAIAERAEHKGLPVRFPLADLQEQMLTDQLNLENNPGSVHDLLDRYSADVFLRVQVSEQQDSLQVRWQLLEHDEILEGQAQADTPETLANEVFTQLARHFIKQYAVLPGEGSELRIQVNNLDMQRLNQTETALQPFSARLVSLDGQQGVWQVRALPEQLRAQLELQRLQELPVPEQTVGMDIKPLQQLNAVEEIAGKPQGISEIDEQPPSMQHEPELKIDMLFGW